MLIAINVGHWTSLSADQKSQTIMHGDGGIPTRARTRATRTLSTRRVKNYTLEGKSRILCSRQNPKRRKENGKRNVKLLATALLSRSLILTTRSGEAVDFRKLSFIHDVDPEVVWRDRGRGLLKIRESGFKTRCAISAQGKVAPNSSNQLANFKRN